jgi:hypothetical protein
MIVKHKDLRNKIADLERKLSAKCGIYDKQFTIVFQAFEELKKVLQPPEKTKKQIGFHPSI